jgi:hypothetical protein
VQLLDHPILWRSPGALRTVMLILCGAGSLSIFLLFTLTYSLEQNIRYPLADLGSLSDYAPGAAISFGVFMVVLMAFYLSAFWTIRRSASSDEGISERAAQLIVLFPILAMLILAHLYPITSLDSINQAVQIRVFTVHQDNPLLTPAAHYSNDPFTTYDDAQNFPSPYGPLAILLSAGPALLAGNNLLALTLLGKMMPILFVLGSFRIVWLIAAKISPQRRWQALLLFGWNPLLLLETAGNGHNDSIVLFFILLAFYFLILGPRWLALPTLAVGALVNSVALIFLPLLIVALWRSFTRWHRLLIVPGSFALAGALLVAAVYPFGGVLALDALLQPLYQYATSLPGMLYNFLLPFYSQQLANLIVIILASCCFGARYLFKLYRFVQISAAQPASEGHLAPALLMNTAYGVAFWFFVLAAFAFHPWMILWLVPFAALDASLKLWIRTTIFAISGLLAPLALIFINHAASLSGTTGPFTAQLIATLVLFLPVILVRSLETIYQRRRLQAALAVKEAELAQLQSKLYRVESAEELTADA